jgi:hypothetical protein
MSALTFRKGLNPQAKRPVLEMQPYYVTYIGINIRSDNILKGKIERCLLIDISILMLSVLGTRI